VFDGVGWGEIVVLLLIGLFVFGPDRLPKAARDAARLLRQLRQMATGVRNDIRSELGPELADLDLRTLHPKTFVRKHLLDDDEFAFPSYLTKRGALDKMLFDDADDPPLSLRKDHGRSTGSTTAISLTKSAPGTAAAKGPEANGAVPALSKAGTATPGPVPAQPEQADHPLPATPYDLDAT
jgi:sec-independent protein translocase protein TatB